jgi:hypothetical protein
MSVTEMKVIRICSICLSENVQISDGILAPFLPHVRFRSSRFRLAIQSSLTSSPERLMCLPRRSTVMSVVR